jgi:hypothetical protein
MTKVFTASLIFVLSFSCAIAQDTKTSRAERIAKAVGIEEMLKATQQKTVEATKEQLMTVFAQFEKSGLPKQYLLQLSDSMNTMGGNIAVAWDPKVASNIYSNAIANAITEQELQDTERYYATDEGKKVHTAITNGQALMMDYVNSRINMALEREMAGFMEKVKEAARHAQAQVKKP